MGNSALRRPVLPLSGTVLGWPARGSSSLLQGAKRAGEEDERVFVGRDVQVVDLPDDDPVIAGGMLGDDLALRVARASVRRGRPPCPGSQSRPAKRSAPGGLARVTRCSCRGARTLTAKRRVRRIRDHVSELRAGQNEISGGSSETDVSELMIRPAGSPSGAAVMNVTPVANRASASRTDVFPALPRRGVEPRPPSQCSEGCSPRATWLR
jgi:hypothetical protein